MRIRSFRNEKRKQYYFRVFNSIENQVLRSEAYNSKAARDNGIESFKKNAPIPKRYERLTSSDGKYYFNIKAANHQVVATSLMFDSEDAQEAAIQEIIAYDSSAGPGDSDTSSEVSTALNVAASSAPESTEAKSTEASKEQDDYMDAAFYQNSGTDTSSGFDSFAKGDNGFSYFSFKSDDGKVLLTSQGYTQESGRDNGIESVKKNAPNEKRYSSGTTDDGKYFFTLKAGNHQEIARSVDFDSEDEMKKAMSIVINGGGIMVEVAKAAPAPAASDDSKEQDDYMDADFYQNSGTDTSSGFDKFIKGDNGFSYFSFKSDDGRVLLLSQGYTQESGRDNGIASVEKNSKIEKRYNTHTTDNGKFYFTLKAGNHQEIARSVDFDSEDEMKKAMSIVMNGGGAMVEVAKAAPAPAAAKNDGMDDYRTFGFYKNSGTDVQNGWDKFHSEKHNEYYFSYKVDGEPVLISEGYTTEAARDNGIASVEKNWGIDKRYKSHETPSGRYYYTLRAGNHQEIARSKWYASGEERDGGVSWLLGGGLGTMAAAGSMKSALISEEAPTAVTEEVIEKTIETPAAEPAEKEDDYLPCKEYEGHTVNDKVNGVAFFKHENGQFYFVVYKEDGSVRLRSEGFVSAKERDVELSGMLKNLDNPDMYETIKRGKYSMHILSDDTGREVGRSCLEKEVEKVVAPPPVEEAPVVEVAAATAVAAAAVSASSSEEVKKEKEDDYLPCKEYEGHNVNDKVNGVAFFKHENEQFYFVVYKEDGSVRLRSEGFVSAKERDVELSGMLKNLNNPDMYETIKRGKYSMHILRDDTGREVGRSCLEKEVEKIVAPPPVEEAPVVEVAAATAIAAAAVSASSSEEVKTEKEDDYLPCKEYEGHEVNDKVNNIAFFKHENGQFYFVVYKEDGSVRLRSEGFTSTKNRDVELSGVIKNLDDPKMYETIKRGKYSIHILSDSTGREVGRSCLEKEAEKVVAPPVVEVAAATAVAAAVVSASATEEVKKEKEDDYLPCSAYEGHTVNDKQNNVAFFKHENGQFYFVVYKKDGSVRLRSEGFESAKNRDDELSALLKNIGNKEMYETLTRGKYRIHILRDKNGREVGRSCLETLEKKKAAPIVEVAAATAVAAAVVSASSSTVEVEKEKEDDYLPCQDYQGHKVTDKKNNVGFFKKDGQFYFVIYKANGDVRLRSEGFKKSKRRDSELSAALKNLDNPDMYETLKRGKYSLHILKDSTGREVGRSCLETENLAVPIAPPVVETAAAITAAAAAAAIVTETVTPPEPEPEIVVEEVVVAPIVTEKVVAAAPVVEKAAAATTAAAASGGFNWMWLLPLLLLIPLFFLFKGCDGCGGKTTATTAPPPVEKPVEKVIPPAAPVEKVTPPPAAPTCNCNTSNNVVFNIKSGTAKVLTRLGTNPEFGNSHSLDPAGFYNKLKSAASSNQRDKQFLDGIFRAMGYNNGFADANASMFSNARIAAGTVGNMGFSSKHRTVKAKLNAQGKDLDAFKIKAANGCDLHFMKTCGNHFFYCPN